MAKKKVHPNKKIIVLSLLLLSLLFGIWAVNYKTGIFNLNEKACIGGPGCVRKTPKSTSKSTPRSTPKSTPKGCKGFGIGCYSADNNCCPQYECDFSLNRCVKRRYTSPKPTTDSEPTEKPRPSYTCQESCKSSFMCDILGGTEVPGTCRSGVCCSY